jgi:2-keto-4-pentenoate hydratase
MSKAMEEQDMDRGVRSRHQAASDFLFELWRTGRVADGLPHDIMPSSRREAYAVQALIEARSTRPRFGWKIAATSKAGQAHIGIDGPIAGRLIAERAFDDGASLRFGANRMRVAEPEFAFRFARDLPPRDAPYDVEEVLAAVASLHPAIEIPDSRYADFASVGAFSLIADNACAHEFVLGPSAPPDWRSRDLATHPVRATVVGKLVRDGSGANVLGDPRIALAWLVNEVSALGVTLRAGETVTTGTSATPLPIAPGDALHADFGPLGAVGLKFHND